MGPSRVLHPRLWVKNNTGNKRQLWALHSAGNGTLEISSSSPSWEMYLRGKAESLYPQKIRKKLFCTTSGAFRCQKGNLCVTLMLLPHHPVLNPSICSPGNKHSPACVHILSKLVVLQGDEQELGVNIQPHFFLSFFPQEAFRAHDEPKYLWKQKLAAKFQPVPGLCSNRGKGVCCALEWFVLRAEIEMMLFDWGG